ncbi:MAG: hypothetical protein AAF462_09175, partial [Thermodesulfobacteriota bacterium]
MKNFLYIITISLALFIAFSMQSSAVDINDACVIVEGLVFCGSKDCRTTSKGEVACGGRSKDCRTTNAGNVACGGLSKDCRTTNAGNV